MARRLTSRLFPGLRSYFRSGWAFLIPYLAAYLLYWWLRWPVNGRSAGLPPPASSLHPPCLLHVYWALHAINLVLAVVAFAAWLRGRTRESAIEQAPAATPAARGQSDAPPPLSPTHHPPSHSHLASPLAPSSASGGEFSQENAESIKESGFPNGDRGVAAPFDPATLHLTPNTSTAALWRIAPWLLLGLLFWIPGVYLEFPADPWGHYARVNEWTGLNHVDQHSEWRKSSYFLSYSVIGPVTPPSSQLRWFDLYYTGCCLLLCWQYYRLARAVGLGERASMIFVLLQTLLFGNNIFGFYRYYGMSSTLFSQLGAIALIRVSLEAAREKRRLETGDREQGPAPSVSSVSGAVGLLPPISCLLRAAVPALALLALTAFNHVQGLGIAALGLAAVAIWRLIEWRRSMIWWLAAAAIILSVAAVLWLPRNPIVDRDYVPQGWFTAWYGFDVFSPSSPAFGRTMAILGLAGVVNLFAGLLFLRQNHVAAWLTITPLFALCLPLVAIPFANAVARRNPVDILTFHRMLLTIPAGLALVALVDCWWKGAARLLYQGFEAQNAEHEIAAVNASLTLADSSLRPLFFLLLTILGAMVLVPAKGPSYNRLFSCLMVVPDDLRMTPVVAALDPRTIQNARTAAGAPLLTAYGQGAVANATGIRNVGYAYRLTWSDAKVVAWPYGLPGVILEIGRQRAPSVLLVTPTAALYSPLSLNGHLSAHWLPQTVALDYAAAPEIAAAARKAGGKEIKTATAMYYSFGD